LISDAHPVPFSADGQLEQLSKSIVYSGSQLANYLDLMGLDLAGTTVEPYTMLAFVDGVERVVGEQVAPALAQYALMVTGLIDASGAASLPKDFRIYPLLTVMQRIMRLGEPARAAVSEWVCALDTGGSSAVVARQRIQRVWALVVRLASEGTVRIAGLKRAFLKGTKPRARAAQQAENIRGRLGTLTRFLGVSRASEPSITMVESLVFMFVLEGCVVLDTRDLTAEQLLHNRQRSIKRAAAE
jgi:hypothetical protein